MLSVLCRIRFTQINKQGIRLLTAEVCLPVGESASVVECRVGFVNVTLGTSPHLWLILACVQGDSPREREGQEIRQAEGCPWAGPRRG